MRSSALLTALLFGLGLPTVQAAPSEVRLVSEVDKSCRHLGSISVQANNEPLFSMWKAFAVTDAGDVFVDALKTEARKQGANRLVIVDIFHNKTIYSGPRTGYGETIDATELRARAFHCS